MTPTDKILWSDMTPQELDSAIARTPLAYWPIGSLEWHGPHLPLATDSFRAEAICRRAAAMTGGVVLPPTYFTAPGFAAYRGTISFSPALVKAIALETHRELAKAGFRALVQLLGHGGQAQQESFTEPAAESTKKLGLRILTTGGGAKLPPEKRLGAGHAGPGETAQCAAAARGKVQLDLFDPAATRLPRYEGLDPDVYCRGLSEPLHERVRMHMARTEWPWAEDLVEQVLRPGAAEELLRSAAEEVARQARELLQGA
jgi:creatinine amidohydrolase